MKRPFLTMAAIGAALIIGIYLMSTPRGLRNKNPFNIKESKGGGIKWQGEHALELDLTFEEFDNFGDGIRAGARILRTYRDKYGLNTIRGIITRFAPSNENNTAAYINSVASQSGIEADAPIETMEDYAAIGKAMIRHENGQQPFDDNFILEHMTRGLA